jgi:PHP family Zn ribbon phosphoesterase
MMEENNYEIDPKTGNVLESFICSTCKIATKHICFGEDMPKDLRWKCTQCDEFTIKRGKNRKISGGRR